MRPRDDGVRRWFGALDFGFRLALGLSLGLAIATVAAAQTPAAPATSALANEPPPLVLAVASVALSLPVHVAEAQGYFAAEGVRVRTVACPGGQACLRQLLDGKAQLATASELPVVLSSFDRSGFAIVATFVTSTRNIGMVARRSAGIRVPGDLVGKRVGVIVGTSSHYYLDAYLLFNGLDPKRVRQVNFLTNELVAALERNEIDALIGYRQHVGPAMKALGAAAVQLDTPRLYTETFNLIADRGVLDKRRDDVVRMLRAIERAERFIAQEPQRALAVLRARVPAAVTFDDAVLKDFDYRLRLEHSLETTMEAQARWALREGHVPPGRPLPQAIDFVDSGPLRSAVPSAFPK